MKTAIVAIALFQIFLVSSAHADNETPPSVIKFQESSRKKMVEESKKFGDPSKPTELDFKSYTDHISSLQYGKKQEEHILSERQLAAPKESTINPIGPILAAEMGCGVVIADVSGVMRRDNGKMSGYRTVMKCENYLIDIQENDYPQTQTQRVFTFIPAEVTNVDLGPGRAIARYFTHPKGGLMATFGWTNDKQEVLVQAISDPQPDALSWNLKMTDVARRVVAARNSQ